MPNKRQYFILVRIFIYAALLTTILGAFYTIFNKPRDEASLAASISKNLSAGNERFLISDVANFPWDHVCLTGSYNSKKALISSYEGLSKEKKRELHSILGINIEYASFVKELPRMSPIGNSWGAYFSQAFLFLKDGHRVKAWRLHDSIEIDGNNYSLASNSKTTCISRKDAEFQVLQSLNQNSIVFSRTREE